MVTRRTLLRGTAQVAALASLAACAPGAPSGSPPARPEPPSAPAAAPAASAPSGGKLQSLELAFCSQVLCILPFEVARQRGFFEAEGLDVSLVYMRSGTQAMNALLAGSLDWIGTPMDLVVQAVAKGKPAVMLASTSQLPFFALMIGPRTSGVQTTRDLAGKTIGVANLGSTDQLLAQYLLTREGVDPSSVEFVAFGANLYEQLARGQVEAGMVQEPSLSLLERTGGRVLVNFMRLDDARRYLGGPYQFMGLNTRPDVLATEADTGRKLIRGLIRANRWMLENPGASIAKAIPEDLVAGGEVELFGDILDKYKRDLYPPDGKLAAESVQRVIEVQQSSGAIEPGQTVRTDEVFTNQYLPEA
jgi:NitT/TauT family transport system substrate-binding protein